MGKVIEWFIDAFVQLVGFVLMIWAGAVWVKILVQWGWIDLSWLRPILTC